MVTLTIDRKTVTVPEGTTILEAARSVHLDIPTLCYLKGVNEIGACRLCTVSYTHLDVYKRQGLYVPASRREEAEEILQAEPVTDDNE